MKRRVNFALFLLVASSTICVALAAPAYWYLYQSRIDGQRACSQTPLGEGWTQISGPYKDAHCEKLVRTK